MRLLFLLRTLFGVVLLNTCKRHYQKVESFTSKAPFTRSRLITAQNDVFESKLVPLSSLSQSSPPLVLGAATTNAADDSKEDDLSTSVSSSSSSTKFMAKEVIALGLPALGGVILDPIMSLVDTACVGQISSLQLAAMAPCTSICQFTFNVFFFMTTTTTSLIAANPIRISTTNNNDNGGDVEVIQLDDKEIMKRKKIAENVLSSGVFLALVLGTVVATALCVFSDLLLIFAGCSNVDMLILSRNYLRIRALGLPFVLVAMVLQGASLGRQDSWTPLKIFTAAGIFNVVGDILLALKLGWGVTGTAVATVTAQVLAATYFALRAIRQSSIDKNKKKTNHERDSAIPRTKIPDAVALKWKGLPTKEILQSYGAFGLIMLLKNIVIMTTFSCMTRCAATMDSTSLAAHLVTMQVWWLISYLPEPMAFSAQSLVARDLKDREYRVPKLLKVLFGMGFAGGVLAALLTGLTLMTPISRVVVADSTVRTMLIEIAPWAMLSQLGSALQYTIESSCVGLADIRHIPIATALASVLCLTGLLGVYRKGLGVVGIWQYSSLYFIIRFAGLFLFSKTLKGFFISRTHNETNKQFD